MSFLNPLTNCLADNNTIITKNLTQKLTMLVVSVVMLITMMMSPAQIKADCSKPNYCPAGWNCSQQKLVFDQYPEYPSTNKCVLLYNVCYRDINGVIEVKIIEIARKAFDVYYNAHCFSDKDFIADFDYFAKLCFDDFVEKIFNGIFPELNVAIPPCVDGRPLVIIRFGLPQCVTDVYKQVVRIPIALLDDAISLPTWGDALDAAVGPTIPLRMINEKDENIIEDVTKLTENAQRDVAGDRLWLEVVSPCVESPTPEVDCWYQQTFCFDENGNIVTEESSDDGGHYQIVCPEISTKEFRVYNSSCDCNVLRTLGCNFICK